MTTALITLVNNTLAELPSDSAKIRFLRTAVHRLLENHAELAQQLELVSGSLSYAHEQAEEAIRVSRPPSDERVASAMLRGVDRRREERLAWEGIR
jgi:hypothetical protein